MAMCRSVPREEAAVDHKRSRSNEPGLVDNGFADHDGLKKKQKVDEPDLPDLPPPPPAAAVEVRQSCMHTCPAHAPVLHTPMNGGL